jgi:hypothetical protein
MEEHSPFIIDRDDAVTDPDPLAIFAANHLLFTEKEAREFDREGRHSRAPDKRHQWSRAYDAIIVGRSVEQAMAERG